MAEAEKAFKINKVKDIVIALLHSEIPEIRTVISELTECTKQLEEHSQKLQDYALKIQELTEGEAEVTADINLIERLRNLERTLTELSGKAAVSPSKSKPEIREIAKEKEEAKEVKEVSPLPGRVITYTTPEGFIVRRRLY